MKYQEIAQITAKTITLLCVIIGVWMVSSYLKPAATNSHFRNSSCLRIISQWANLWYSAWVPMRARDAPSVKCHCISTWISTFTLRKKEKENPTNVLTFLILYENCLEWISGFVASNHLKNTHTRTTKPNISVKIVSLELLPSLQLCWVSGHQLFHNTPKLWLKRNIPPQE